MLTMCETAPGMAVPHGRQERDGSLTTPVKEPIASGQPAFQPSLNRVVGSCQFPGELWRSDATVDGLGL